MAIGILTALWGVGAWAADCPDLGERLDELELEVFEGRLDDAAAGVEELEAAFACAIASPEQLARFWIAEGAVLTYRADASGAVDSFAAAARVAPGVWNPNYGTSLQGVYEAASGSVSESATGQISLVDPSDRAAWVDGVPASPPVTAPMGLHLVQAGPDATSVDFGKLLYLPSGETVELTLPPVAPPPEPIAATPVPAPVTAEPEVSSGRPWGWLAASGGAAALAAGASVLALQQNSAIDGALTVDEARGAHQRQLAYGITGYSMMGVAAVGLGIYIF